MRCSRNDENPGGDSRAVRGAAAEDSAVRFLERAGLRTIDRNVRCRFGEIDIVAREDDCLVFVEVRLRASQKFGGAVGSVDARKQQRLVGAARWFLGSNPRFANEPCRFDVIAVSEIDGAVDWLRDAFRVDS